MRIEPHYGIGLVVDRDHHAATSSDGIGGEPTGQRAHSDTW
jgi:hypothetical protein